jgi:hypothetical protein
MPKPAHLLTLLLLLLLLLAFHIQLILRAGADRKEGKTVASTKRPMPIITEQEAVAPEAFPNPAAGISPKPAVLAAAEGDEQRGASRGQFEGITAADRQRLIDEKSPAQASKN